MKVGDLVRWRDGYCMVPGLVLETKPTLPPAGERPATAVLALLPELSETEWFHETELELISETR